MKKKFGKLADEFIPIAVGFGYCIASDRITVDGKCVGYMFRKPPNDKHDSGWRFFAGDESEEYAGNPNNFELYDVNTIANYDPTITQYLEATATCRFERDGATGRFIALESLEDED